MQKPNSPKNQVLLKKYMQKSILPQLYSESKLIPETVQGVTDNL